MKKMWKWENNCIENEDGEPDKYVRRMRVPTGWVLESVVADADGNAVSLLFIPEK